MFLSLFPLPEVATIIAFCLALIYVSLGIFGANQVTAEEISVYQNVNQVQEQQYQTFENSHFSERTYHWSQSHQDLRHSKEPLLFLLYSNFSKPVFIKKQVKVPNYCLRTSLPRRAPPVV